MKKHLKPISIIIILIFLIILLLFIFRNKTYSRTYDFQDYTITEEYLTNPKHYYYQIKNSNLTYEYILEHKYKGKELITNIESYNQKNEECLIIQNKLSINTILCSKDNQQISFHLISDELKSLIPSEYKKEYSTTPNTYQDFTIYNSPIHPLYIWNYKGFDYYQEEFKTQNLFDKDVYNTDMITTINDYILVPDYTNEYNIEKFIIINTKNNKPTTWELDYEISMDSYILGIQDKSLYIMDCKNLIEYELVPHKKKMRIIATENDNGKIYQKGEWKNIKVREIINDHLTFTEESIYHYNIIDNKLYLSYDSNNQILISNENITSIIAINNSHIYYLAGNKLYYYSPPTGEILLIEKEEWLFNNNNKIFIIF